jgi:hypothetical protein
MKVVDNTIVYSDHIVVCDPAIHADMPEYVAEMAQGLSLDGDMRTHARELRLMNNDGTWGIKALA